MRKESLIKVCPICGKKVAARGYVGHLTLAHKITSKERPKPLEENNPPKAINGLGWKHKQKRPIYTKSQAAEILEGITIVFGAVWAIKQIAEHFKENKPALKR